MTMEEPKLHIDSDWKAEAQAEKERLATKAAEEELQNPAGRQGLPEASFRSLVGVLASQALMGLGTMVDPDTKGVVVDLEGARFSIDLLGVVDEKTTGNLTDEETKELTQLLAELRSRYVQVAALVAKSASEGGVVDPAAGAAGGPLVS